MEHNEYTPHGTKINEYYQEVLHCLQECSEMQMARIVGSWVLHHNTPSHCSQLIWIGQTQRDCGMSASLLSIPRAMWCLAFPHAEKASEREQISEQGWYNAEFNGQSAHRTNKGFPVMFLAVAKPLEEVFNTSREVLWRGLVLNNGIRMKINFMNKIQILFEQTLYSRELEVQYSISGPNKCSSWNITNLVELHWGSQMSN